MRAACRSDRRPLSLADYKRRGRNRWRNREETYDAQRPIRSHMRSCRALCHRRRARARDRRSRGTRRARQRDRRRRPHHGRVEGRVARTGARDRGAPVDDVWVWTDAPLRARRDRARHRPAAHAARLSRSRRSSDRGEAMAARGAAWELSATHVERIADDAGVRRSRVAVGRRRPGRVGVDAMARPALRGIATGDRGDVSPALDQRWRAVGIFHVLSVSRPAPRRRRRSAVLAASAGSRPRPLGRPRAARALGGAAGASSSRSRTR